MAAGEPHRRLVRTAGDGPVSNWDPVRTRLTNGLTLLQQRNAASAAVTISLSVPAGSAFEPRDKAGLATLVARGLMRGTERRDKMEIGEVLDYRGAHLAGSGGRHTAGLVAQSRAEDFEVLLELLAESAYQPVFPETEVDKLKGDRRTALREDEDDPATVVMHAFRELVYPRSHPYAQRIRGTLSTVESITADDVRQFHARHYRAGDALVVIVGNVDPGLVREAVERCLGPWSDDPPGIGFRAAQVSIPDAVELGAVTRRVIEMPDKSQVDIALGHPSIRRDDHRYYAATLLNTVLGRFAMGGRLGRSVREDQGMAYYTYSTLQAGLGPGPFLVRAGLQPEHVEPAVASILAEIERIRSEPVGDEELDNAKAATIRSLPRTLESNEGIAGVLQQIELYDLGLDYLERFEGLVGAVDTEAVAEAARELLHPDAYGLAIAGPYREVGNT